MSNYPEQMEARSAPLNAGNIPCDAITRPNITEPLQKRSSAILQQSRSKRQTSGRMERSNSKRPCFQNFPPMAATRISNSTHNKNFPALLRLMATGYMWRVAESLSEYIDSSKYPHVNVLPLVCVTLPATSCTEQELLMHAAGIVKRRSA